MSCITAPIMATNLSLVDPLMKPQPAMAPVSKSQFTVSYTNRASGASLTTPVCAREDVTVQKAAADVSRQQQIDAFIAEHEKRSVMTEGDRRASTIILLNMAAQRDVEAARQADYPQQVVDFMCQTWSAFIAQAKEFYLPDAEKPHTMELSRTALENISSIGIWFNGPQISLPLRRYTVQVVGTDGNPQSITAVGLLSFAYSSYVMQLRSMAQQSTLENLARIQEQLGAKTFFVPQLLVAPS
ncbi:putative mitochondrial hypothetical protein [Leptomonas pyrrhocoris]|uniref:Uncharacterized protein n=1 Tax=Leptomonas pyrrhocoris TaxID=157538 RepID=A0A0N0DZR0_LEPPY|nr:putative mitochondrial hypothetical protein [Leptomonas pyrrhocoris]KPA85591.1 putative mitochondrial hypothetical protein [Leptomonas pyrrhocoris]|eukprot:XP_015664030.1 putative mitochondrial hypothetical protein [Leptomonas pyrrhocoris]